MSKLLIEFYAQSDACRVAHALVGKRIVRRINGKELCLCVVETEAYQAMLDRASHAFQGKCTPRNEAMYGTLGTVYTYLLWNSPHI